MEKEVDLRSYFYGLINNWYWILGLTILATVLTFIVTSFLPHRYQSTALVTITVPREIILASLTSESVDPKFETVTDKNLLFKGYAELALSDQILEDVLIRLDPPPEDISDVTSLRNILSAGPGEDISVLRLSAKYSDPQEATKIVNLWASLFVPWANQVYGLQGEEQISFYETQLADASENLEKVEEELIHFQSSNNRAIIENELNFAIQSQTDYLILKKSLVLLEQDIASFRDLLKEGRRNVLTFSDALTIIALQLRVFNAETAVPLQINVDSAENLVRSSREEQLDFLESLISTIQGKISQVDSELSQVEPTILELQKELQETENKGNQLERNHKAAEETYTALSRKVQEEYVSSQEASSGVRLASKASIPKRPIEPQRLILTVLAGLFTFFAVSFAVLVIYWLRSTANNEQNE